MAIPRMLERALFFTGILASGREELALAAARLGQEFGEPFLASPVWPFENTDYYRDELGPRPIRAFLAWPDDFDTTAIATRKLTTNALENELADAAHAQATARGDVEAALLSRPINLDPGYLTLAKLVLASAKNFSHRIHLGHGIYAEVTLQYRHGQFHSLPWTFPDFKAGRYDGFFLTLRQRLQTPS